MPYNGNMKPIDPKDELFSSLLRNTPEPAKWGALTQGEVEGLRAYCTKVQRRAQKASGWVVFVLFVVWVGALIRIGPEFLPFGIVLALALPLMLGTMTFSAFLGKAAQITLGDLSPLKDNFEQCQEALNLVKSPGAAAYRDRVVAAGRELLRGDLEAMKTSDLQHRTADACRELHGLPLAEVAPLPS